MGVFPAPVGTIASRLYDPSAVALPAAAVPESFDVYTIWNNFVTESAHPALVAGAREGVHAIHTRSIDAWVRITFVNVVLAVTSIESRSTRAGIRIDAVQACSPVLTRVGGAFVDIDFAVVARVAGGAGTSVVIDAIGTHAVVLTRIRGAFVDIDLAVTSIETRSTRASIRVVAVCACSSVLTRARGTIVNIALAVASIKTRSTRAGMGIDAILACSPVLTRAGGTIVDVFVAQGACPALVAYTFIGICTVHALAIDTIVFGAVINASHREWGEGAFGISSLRGLLPCFGEGLIEELVAIGVRDVVGIVGDGHYKVMSRNPGLVEGVGRIFGSRTFLNDS